MARKKKTQLTKRKLEYADLEGQVYGVIEKILGNRFFDVKCLDNKMRRCKVRKKRMKIKQDDVVIVSLREFDDINADIVHRYDSEEVRSLQKEGILPSKDFVNVSEDVVDEVDDGGFIFEDI